ncbi:phosphoribosyl-AMP cyclohydrolase [Candidatus Rariloculus sp.]|uniref:phosphoribosyl-AMP cyclohydrolase n=1 Tax=Candidatus Rariloculus sp. TaxID=3101265 RepID=UPI003D1153CF
MSSRFRARVNVEKIEAGTELAPKFDAHGLIPAVTTDFDTGEVLMLGYMNGEALEKTIQTGEAHYFSRSRQVLWHKGATSGLIQKVRELLIDDDQDCVWLRVEVVGGASCHVGYRSCFYRRIPVPDTDGRAVVLEFIETAKVFAPEDVYGDAPNPTQV